MPLSFLLVFLKNVFFFSHTIKKQPYNRSLLQKMVKLNIQMVDYELLKDSYNKRLLVLEDMQEL